MKTIYFIRHGDKIIDIGDVGLTELGKKQSRDLGMYFKNTSIDYLLSSPYKRTSETATIIGSILHIPIYFDDRLKERIFFGEIPNQSYTEYVSLCKKSSIHRDFILPNGSSSHSVGRRVEQLINELLASVYNTIAIISHEGTIADYIRTVFSDKTLLQQQPEFMNMFTIKPASITTITYEKSEIQLQTLGSILQT